MRDALVRTRARFISLIRALLRREGLRVASGMARNFSRRPEKLTLPDPLSAAFAPLLAVMEALNHKIAAADARLAAHAAADTHAPLMAPLHSAQARIDSGYAVALDGRSVTVVALPGVRAE